MKSILERTNLSTPSNTCDQNIGDNVAQVENVVDIHDGLVVGGELFGESLLACSLAHDKNTSHDAGSKPDGCNILPRCPEVRELVIDKRLAEKAEDGRNSRAVSATAFIYAYAAASSGAPSFSVV
jgi:hypothetical protein